jgi:pyruvate formate lyase activating enzyme
MTTPVSRRDFLRQCGRSALVCASLEAGLLTFSSSRSHALTIKKGLLGRKLSPFYTELGDGQVRCELCPRFCEVEDGDRGYCGVRENVGGKYYSLVYGNPCALHVDPIEKKPFYHVLPTSRSFSLATAGCNFDCKFCQNWEISQARPDETHNYEASPEQIVQLAARYKCESIASTYVEPTIFTEYMIDIGRLAKRRGLLKVMHSNGFINPAPLRRLCRYLDAACIDLKGFTEAYYQNLTEGMLEPVLDTLRQLKRTGIHTEIVNLVVPGKNDDKKQVTAMCRWIKNELGPDVPLHFSRFYPLYKLKSLPPTPVSTLEQARETALKEGLHYVYIGNVPGHAGEHTYCPKCGIQLIQRLGYRVKILHLKEGSCDRCGLTVPGIWQHPRQG